MYIPILKRMLRLNDVLVERALPCAGRINVSSGDKVEAFTELGGAKVSYKSVPLPSQLKFVEGKGVGSHFYAGEKIGHVGLTSIRAPFSCVVLKVDGRLELDEEKRDYLLISGIWGEVVDVVKSTAVLLKTQVVDLHLMACMETSIEGELIVFPNPSEVLQMQYLERFSKNVFSKVVYVGDTVDLPILEKGLEMGVAGILAGSAGKDCFNFAKAHGLFLGTFSGFGEGHTPKPVFDFLNEISNRFVFVYGERNLLRIPLPEPSPEDLVVSKKRQRVLTKLKVGLRVLVVNEDHFGYSGTVEKILDSRILVRLDRDSESLEVLVPNLLALE